MATFTAAEVRAKADSMKLDAEQDIEDRRDIWHMLDAFAARLEQDEKARPALLDQRVYDLALSARAYNILLDMRVETIREILNMRPSQWERISKKPRAEIIAVLAELGIQVPATV